MFKVRKQYIKWDLEDARQVVRDFHTRDIESIVAEDVIEQYIEVHALQFAKFCASLNDYVLAGLAHIEVGNNRDYGFVHIYRHDIDGTHRIQESYFIEEVEA